MTLDRQEIEGFPDDTPARPAWLMTLADLALLLVGFFVFVQAAQHLDQKALAKGIRDGFRDTPSVEEPMPVAAAAMPDFAPASATLPASPDALTAWAREATRDPRVTLRISGNTDGSTSDIDPATGSAALLAADRARAVAAALAPVVPAARMTIVNATGGRSRSVVVTLGFSGGALPESGNDLPPGNALLPFQE